ncbi:hypothetical protein D3C73_1020500 [compost metagenome]
MLGAVNQQLGDFARFVNPAVTEEYDVYRQGARIFLRIFLEDICHDDRLIITDAKAPEHTRPRIGAFHIVLISGFTHTGHPFAFGCKKPDIQHSVIVHAGSNSEYPFKGPLDHTFLVKR